MNRNKVERIRESVEQAKAGPDRRPRYSEFVKSTAQDLLSSGMKAAELANLTGISRASLFQWSKRKASRHKRKRFRSLSVEPRSPVSTGLRIVLTSGVLIECPSVDCLKAILESLP